MADFPRPFGRGPIDGTRASVRKSRGCCFPRPFGRGPIDGAGQGPHSGGAECFPRPFGRGPIDGQYHTCPGGQGALSAAVWPRPH